MTYYIIYKITNNINGHYYIGMHTTNNIEDDYMGSGVLIKKAIIFYGINNFTKTIIKKCNSRKTMFMDERKIVNKDIVNDKNSYNLITGGKRKSKNTYKVKAKIKNCKELLK